MPVNAQKKQNIVATILRNLGDTFAGGRIVTASKMKFGRALQPAGQRLLDQGTRDVPGRGPSTLPVGEQKFSGVTYQHQRLPHFARALVHYAALAHVDGRLPAEATVQVGRKADALFFLQGYIPAR